MAVILTPKRAHSIESTGRGALDRGRPPEPAAAAGDDRDLPGEQIGCEDIGGGQANGLVAH